MRIGYKIPEIEIIEITELDIITTSGESDNGLVGSEGSGTGTVLPW